MEGEALLCARPNLVTFASLSDRITAREAILLGITFLLIAVFAYRPIWDIDLFWHLVLGRIFVESGALVHKDLPSAIDPNGVWISLQWGYEVLVHLLDRAIGLAGLRAIHALVQWIGFLAFWWGARRRLGFTALESLGLVWLLVLLHSDRFRERPEVFTFVELAVLVPYVARGPRSLDPRAVAVAFLLSVYGALLHAGYQMLIVVAAVAIPIGAVLERLGRVETDVRRAFLWYGALLFGALVVPDFVGGNWQTHLRYGGHADATPEWQPPWNYVIAPDHPAQVVLGLAPVALLALVGVLGFSALRALRERRTPELPLSSLGFALALGYLAQRSTRFIELVPFALIPLWPAVRRFRVDRRASMGAIAILAALAFDYDTRFVYGDFGSLWHRLTKAGPLNEKRFPTTQANWLERSGFEGAIFAQPDWGAYLLYRLWPKARILADARGNHSAEVTDDLLVVGNLENFRDPRFGPDIEKIYLRYPCDVLVLQHPVWPRGFSPDPARWVRVQADPKGEIWVRLDREAGRRFFQTLAAP